MPRDGGQLDLLVRGGLRPPPSYYQAFDQTEHELQIDCTAMLWKILLPEVCWTAIDHAHSLNMQIGRHGRPIGILEAQKRVARGIQPGIADYLFWHRSNAFAIELKTVNGVLHDDQKVWLRRMIKAGGEVSVCFSFDQVVAKVREWDLCRGFVVMA
jgi:VRR-NUC domain